MKSLFLRLMMSVSLLGGAAAVCAEQVNSRGEGRSRSERLQVDRPAQAERTTRSDEVRSNRDEEAKPARMSREQRKALRQQINEAGQDIYQPKR